MLYAVLARRWYLSGVLLLAACGAEPPSNEQAKPPEADAPLTPPAPTSATPQATSPQAQASQLAEKAEQALREERLFAPAGGNAFELFLQAHELDRDNVFARDALFDLIPYAVLHIEQRIAAKDRDEAQRLLPLLQRAQPDAPALPRLQGALARLPAETVPASPVAKPDAPRPQSPATASPAVVPAQEGVASVPAPRTDASTTATNAETPSTPTTNVIAPVETPVVQEPSSPPESAPVTRTLPPAQIVVPEPISRAAPRYPVLAERRKIEGSVELEFTIQTDGSVGNVRVLRSQPEGIFDRDAIAAMQRWRYPPVPAAIKARRSFDFKLGKR